MGQQYSSFSKSIFIQHITPHCKTCIISQKSKYVPIYISSQNHAEKYMYAMPKYSNRNSNINCDVIKCQVIILALGHLISHIAHNIMYINTAQSSLPHLVVYSSSCISNKYALVLQSREDYANKRGSPTSRIHL